MGDVLERQGHQRLPRAAQYPAEGVFDFEEAAAGCYVRHADRRLLEGGAEGVLDPLMRGADLGDAGQAHRRAVRPVFELAAIAHPLDPAIGTQQAELEVIGPLAVHRLGDRNPQPAAVGGMHQREEAFGRIVLEGQQLDRPGGQAALGGGEIPFPCDSTGSRQGPLQPLLDRTPLVPA